MAQDLSEKELLRMEVEQLKKEAKNPRDPVSPSSLLLQLLHLPVGVKRRHRPRTDLWTGVGYRRRLGSLSRSWAQGRD